MPPARKRRSTRTDSAPTVLVTVGVECRPARTPGSDLVQRVEMASWSIHASRRRSGRWGDHEHVDGTDLLDFWDTLDSFAEPRRRVYVACQSAGDLLTLLGWWHRVADGLYVVWGARDGGRVVRADPTSGERRRTHPLVLSGQPDIVGYDSADGSFRWVSAANHNLDDLGELARRLGMPLGRSALSTAMTDLSRWRAVDVSALLHLAYQELLGWWARSECGTWGDSPGTAAWSSYMRRQGPDQVAEHDDPAARELEDEACHGGRAEAWYRGAVGTHDQWAEHAHAPPRTLATPALAGPVHRLDIRGLYPSIMRDEVFPVRLIGLSDDLTPESLGELLKLQGAVARVQLRVREAEYPVRQRARVVYPRGIVETTLAGPDLVEALADGAVERVDLVARYELGRPYRPWAEWAIRLRQNAPQHGGGIVSTYAKAISVSLSGRLARRRIGWVDEPETVCPVEWGQWWVLQADDGTSVEWRSLGGHAQRRETSGERPGTYAAGYAYLTAYGRQRMRGVREVAGWRQTLWQHTDGVVVTSAGRDALAREGWLNDTVYGLLKDEGPIHVGQWYGGSHWWADGAYTLSGFASGWELSDDGTCIVASTANPARQANDPRHGWIVESLRRVGLHDLGGPAAVGADGWTIPPTLRAGVRDESPDDLYDRPPD